MGKDYILKRAKSSNVSEILVIVSSLSRVGRLLPRTAQDVQRFLAGFMVLTIDGKVIACGELRIYNLRMAEVWSWGVLEEYEGFGYETVVMQSLIARARKIGIEKIYIVSDQVRALKNLGFKPATGDERYMLFFYPQRETIATGTENDNEIVIRPAVVKDLPQIEAMIALEVRKHHLLPRTSRELLQLITGGFSWVAVSGADRLVGHVCLDVYNHSQAELRSLVVKFEFQGKSVASQLILTVCQKAKTVGVVELTAVTGTTKLFENSGFAFANSLLHEAWWIYPKE